MQESLDYHYTFKYIVVGDSSVGKTSILANYHHKKINDESNPTMGVEYSSKKIEVHGNSIKLQIWDTVCDSFRCRPDRNHSAPSPDHITKMPLA